MKIVILVRVEVEVDIEVVVEEEDTTVETMVDIVVVVAAAMTDIDVRPHHITGVMTIGGELDPDLIPHVSYYIDWEGIWDFNTIK